MKRHNLAAAGLIGACGFLIYQVYARGRRTRKLGLNHSQRVDKLGHYDLDGVSHDYDLGIVVGGGAKSSTGTRAG